MKKVTRTWILYCMVIVHILSVLGSTGVIIFLQVAYPGIWNWFLLVLVSFFNYFVFDSMFSYIKRINRRQTRKL